MFTINGVTKPAAYVAKQIHLLWVQRDASEFFKLEDLHLPESKRGSFFSGVYLLCEAASLRVLLMEAKSDKRYQELVRQFELVILPSAPISEGIAKLQALKTAIRGLNELFTEENKQLGWCRRWFQGIGYDETNPATLFLFAWLIGEHTRSLRQLLRDIRPPAAGSP